MAAFFNDNGKRILFLLHNTQHANQPYKFQQLKTICETLKTSPQPIPRLSHPTNYHLQQTQLRQQQQQTQLRHQQKAIAVNDGVPNIGAPNDGAPNNGSLPTPNNSFNNGSTIDPTLITAGQQLHQPSYNGATNVIKQESTDIQQTEMDFDHHQQFLSPQSDSPLGSPTTNLDVEEFGQPFNPQNHIEILEIPSPYPADSPHNSYNSQTSMSLPVQFAANNSEWFNPNFETGSSYPLLYSTTTPEMNYLSTIMDPDGGDGNAQKAAMLSEKKRRRRESHNADNINEQIQELSRLLPDVFMDSSNKPNKGLILRKSVDYIKHLKNTVDVQSNQMVKLESKFKQLETSDTSSFSFAQPHNKTLASQCNENIAIATQQKMVSTKKSIALDDVSNINNLPNISSNLNNANNKESANIRNNNVILPVSANLKKRTADVARNLQLKNQQIPNNINYNNVIEKKQKIEENQTKAIETKAITVAKQAISTKTATTNITNGNEPYVAIDPILVTTVEAVNYEAELEKTRAKKIRTQEWDDLDLEDMYDPMTVAEYAVEIFDYLRILEGETMPKPNYMENQIELSWRMRIILIDWLIEVHYKFRLLPETLFLTVNIVDRFLSERVVSMVKLQLVGITALFISGKYEEVLAPSIKNYIYMSEEGYTDEDILNAERYVLQTIDYKLNYPNPMNFLRRISRADHYYIPARTVAKYLMEITLLDHAFLTCKPSMIAAASLYLARIMLKCGEWTANLIHYSTYTEEQIKPWSKLILQYLIINNKHVDQLYLKYSTKKFMKASIFVRDWLD
nr:5105_t:CDS:2 [Entrophospora candida]